MQIRWREERQGHITDIECFEPPTMTRDHASRPDGPVAGSCSQMVNLDYKIVTSPVHRRFDEQMREGRIVGHKCPSCGRVYVPPKGFCPMCCVVTGGRARGRRKDTGVVTSFTVITPIQYRGQKEKEEYVLANVLLDGADSDDRPAAHRRHRERRGAHGHAREGGVGEEGGPRRKKAAGCAAGGSARWSSTGSRPASRTPPREHYQEHVL